MKRKVKTNRVSGRPSHLIKRYKADAAKIKKAQTKLKEALNLIKNIQGHAELDMAKYAIQYTHQQMSMVTRWLDGTQKPALNPVETIDAELDEALDVEVERDIFLPRPL